jgi:hypothetical protein
MAIRSCLQRIYFKKAMNKLERQINECLPSLELITLGFSAKVKGVNGPLADGEMNKAKRVWRENCC